jgi:hypothetical protein
MDLGEGCNDVANARAYPAILDGAVREALRLEFAYSARRLGNLGPHSIRGRMWYFRGVGQPLGTASLRREAQDSGRTVCP